MSAPESLTTALAGRYTLLREIGRGGMATVYLARDVRHARQVAIKVLHPELAAVLGAERFLAEITTTANLQHPHILPLFDSGTADGQLFYVMPFVEGETLRARLDRETQLPIADAVQLAREVADALQYAHERGVIHRDIKPENILLHGGHALVADFGIALAVQHAGGQRMTQTGLSLGTPQYMAPEQAMGEKSIDARADLYALGAVTYEMLAGEPPFTGPTAQAIVAKVMTASPAPLTTLRAKVPAHLDAAVLHALEKLPADRVPSARAFAEALRGGAHETAAATKAVARVDMPDERRRRAVSNGLLVGACTAAIVAATGWWWSAQRSAVGTLPVQFTLSVPDSARIRPDLPRVNVTISPDGRRIAYVGGNGNGLIYLRDLDNMAVRPLAGTQQGRHPQFSPDNAWLAFIQSGVLRKLPLSGGAATLLATGVTSYSWTDPRQIVFVRDGDLWRMGADGGTPSLVARHDSAAPGTTFGWPEVLPEAKSALFDIVTAGDHANGVLAAVRLDDGSVTRLGVVGRNPRFVAPDILLFSRLDGTLWATRFDSRALTVRGAAVRVLDEVYTRSGGATSYSISRDGTLVHVIRNSESELLVVDRTGAARSLEVPPRDVRAPRVSPDGRRIAFEMADRSSPSRTDIWMYETGTRTLSRLTNDGVSLSPEWMSDGERLVWISRDSTRAEVRRQRWDGAGRVEVLLSTDASLAHVSPSADGRQFLVVRIGGFSDIYIASADSLAVLRPLVVTPQGEGGPRFSPDGRSVAYYGDESGQTEVYVVAADGGGRHVQISLDGGREPVWSSDGRTVFYRADGVLIAAELSFTPALSVLRRTVVLRDRFQGSRVRVGAYDTAYDVWPDGRSFVFTGGIDRSNEVMVVTSAWVDELRRRMAGEGRQ